MTEVEKNLTTRISNLFSEIKTYIESNSDWIYYFLNPLAGGNAELFQFMKENPDNWEDCIWFDILNIESSSMAFIKGAQWADAHLWHPADGEDLPELEREVVVFTQNFPNDAGIMRVGIAHRPNPNGWDGRNILTGKVEHFEPKTYGKGGWSLPDVKWWLDCKMPYKEGGEE